MWPQDVPRERAGRQETGGDATGGEPRLFRYTPTMSQPLSVPPQAWPGDDPAAMPGFEFDDWTQNAAPPDAIPLGAPPFGTGSRVPPPARRARAGRRRRAGAEEGQARTGQGDREARGSGPN